MNKEFVINKETKKVRCWGYCDFTKDETFDPDTEFIIENDFILDPDIDIQDWYWNDETNEFQKG